jgi:hypothetical protein
MRRVRVEVLDEHGTAVVVVPELTAEQRAALDGVLPPLTLEEGWRLLAVLTRQIADEQAYERVCAQRGLLL